jgi:hypothetical protein
VRAVTPPTTPDLRDRAAAECRLGAEHPPRTCLYIWLAERPRFME